jgi:hypothetical protein
MVLTASPGYDQLVSDIQEAYHADDMAALENIVLTQRTNERALYAMTDSRVTRLIPGIRRKYCAYETTEEQLVRAKLRALLPCGQRSVARNASCYA